MAIFEMIVFALLLLGGFCAGVWLGLTLDGKEPGRDERKATAVPDDDARLLEERERQWQNLMNYNGEARAGE